MRKLVVAVIVLVPSLAMAQVKQVPQHKQFVDFNDHELNTTVDRPDLGYDTVLPRKQFSSLIKLRANFDNELKTSVETLR